MLLHTLTLLETVDVPGHRGKSEEERLNATVSQIVIALTGQQHLRLGDYKMAPIPAQDMEIVKRLGYQSVQ
jgi:hypothetical protein